MEKYKFLEKQMKNHNSIRKKKKKCIFMRIVNFILKIMPLLGVIVFLFTSYTIYSASYDAESFYNIPKQYFYNILYFDTYVSLGFLFLYNSILIASLYIFINSKNYIRYYFVIILFFFISIQPTWDLKFYDLEFMSKHIANLTETQALLLRGFIILVSTFNFVFILEYFLYRKKTLKNQTNFNKLINNTYYDLHHRENNSDKRWLLKEITMIERFSVRKLNKIFNFKNLLYDTIIPIFGVLCFLLSIIFTTIILKLKYPYVIMLFLGILFLGILFLRVNIIFENLKFKVKTILTIFAFIIGVLPIVFLLVVWLKTFCTSYTIILDNTRYSKKKEYTIVKHTDSSKEKDVDIVILDKGSQIITMKGEVNDNELKIFTDNFEIRDSDGLKFRFKNFSNVVTASNMEDNG
jgi:membrane protein